MATEAFDVLIIGAGLSGIGAAYRLQSMCPGKRYAILESRGEIGGTWDLFRYPGMRSDSDMFTLGYPFRPWKETRAITERASILQYIRATAKDCGIEPHIRFNHQVQSASWSSREARWTLEIKHGDHDTTSIYSCAFMYVCTGYYSYEGGYSPDFPGIEAFQGTLIHPQKWPHDFDYADKNIVIIGSGATAVTLLPALSQKARHVTMLQRSPSYIASLPATDALADILRKLLPSQMAHRLARWKNVLLNVAFYQFCRRAPGLAMKLLRYGMARELPKDFAIDQHFTPHYSPWDQRLCVAPDADFFAALKSGKASIATDQIQSFTENGIRLSSGAELKADIIVSATGLKLLACGGMRIDVDGRPVDFGDTLVYKGALLSGLPNFAFCVGYTYVSWTLRADLSSMYVCRLINYMDKHGFKSCIAQCTDPTVQRRPLLDISSGYVVRASPTLPKQGSKDPWHHHQNYFKDLFTLKYGQIADQKLTFS